MRRFRHFILLLILAFTLSACGGGDSDRLSPEDIRGTAVIMAVTQIAETSAAMAVPPTEPPAPVPVTDTPELAASTQPPVVSENVIFRDDFNGQLDEGWFWESEIPEQWTITPDGWLQITADDDGLVNVYRQNNLLFRDIPSGEFSISTFVRANPTKNYQQAAIYLYLDNQNYVSVNRAFCSIARCKTNGNGVFMEYQIGGVWWFFSVPLAETEVYLKITMADNQITGYYATIPGEWVQINFINQFAAFTKVGLSASNVDSVGQEDNLVAEYDYFEISAP